MHTCVRVLRVGISCDACAQGGRKLFPVVGLQMIFRGERAVQRWSE